MSKEIIQDILKYIRERETLEAQQKIEQALLKQATVCWEGRFQQVQEINRAILQLNHERKWYQRNLELLPEDKRALVRLQIRQVEEQFYLTPLKRLKQQKQKLSLPKRH